MEKKWEKIKRIVPNHPEIIGRENYFNAAIMITLIEIEDTYHFVFEKRAAHIRQGGEISFPGGGYEPEDIDFKATAIRETCEELGINREDLTVLGQLGTYVGRQGVIIEAYIGCLNFSDIKRLRPEPGEVERVFTVPVSFFEDNLPTKYAIRMEKQPYYVDPHGERIELLPAAKLGLPQRYHRPWSGELLDVYFYSVENEWIWGLTAELINDVIYRLKTTRREV